MLYKSKTILCKYFLLPFELFAVPSCLHRAVEGRNRICLETVRLRTMIGKEEDKVREVSTS